jgi:hypothetical protein
MRLVVRAKAMLPTVFAGSLSTEGLALPVLIG